MPAPPPQFPPCEDPLVIAFARHSRDVLGEELVQILWFGSRARGEGAPDSDYDFLVETRNRIGEDLRDRMADIAIDLCADFGAVLDVHYYSSERMQKSPERYTPFLQTVREEGVRV